MAARLAAVVDVLRERLIADVSILHGFRDIGSDVVESTY